jgi:transcriptional regulator with XRE-family HTH domain
MESPVLGDAMLRGGSIVPSTMAGVRGYLRELRQRKRISQKALAEAIELSLRAFVDWETGETEDLKGGPLVRAVVFLEGNWEHIQHLVETGASEEEGREVAARWLREQHEAAHPPPRRESTTKPGSDSDVRSRQIAEKYGHDHDIDLLAVIEELRADIRRLEQRIEHRDGPDVELGSDE